jgi:hypothetical protein
MGEVIAFKPKMTAQDQELFRRRWFCELLGFVQIVEWNRDCARKLFKIRFGVLPDETAPHTAITSSAATSFWVTEQTAIRCEREGDHKQAAAERALIVRATPEWRRQNDARSDAEWKEFCYDCALAGQGKS